MAPRVGSYVRPASQTQTSSVDPSRVVPPRSRADPPRVDERGERNGERNSRVQVAPRGPAQQPSGAQTTRSVPPVNRASQTIPSQPAPVSRAPSQPPPSQPAQLPPRAPRAPRSEPEDNPPVVNLGAIGSTMPAAKPPIPQPTAPVPQQSVLRQPPAPRQPIPLDGPLAEIQAKLDNMSLEFFRDATGGVVHDVSNVLLECPLGHVHRYVIGAIMNQATTKVDCTTCASGTIISCIIRETMEDILNEPFMFVNNERTAITYATFPCITKVQTVDTVERPKIRLVCSKATGGQIKCTRSGDTTTITIQSTKNMRRVREAMKTLMRKNPGWFGSPSRPTVPNTDEPVPDNSDRQVSAPRWSPEAGPYSCTLEDSLARFL